MGNGNPDSYVEQVRLRYGLSSSAASALRGLIALADAEGRVSASEAEIGEAAGVARVTASRGIERLEERHGIVTSHGPRKRNGGRPKAYRIRYDVIAGEVGPADEVTQRMLGEKPRYRVRCTADGTAELHRTSPPGERAQPPAGERAQATGVSALTPPPSTIYPSPTPASGNSNPLQAGDGTRGPSTVIWGERLTAQDLQDPGQLAKRLGTAIGQGQVEVPLDPEAIRELLTVWFGWAHYCRTAAGVKNPPGLFTAGMTEPDQFGRMWWDRVRPQDRAWAEGQLRRGIGPRAAREIQQGIEQAARSSQHVREKIISTKHVGDALQSSWLGTPSADSQKADLKAFDHERETGQ